MNKTTATFALLMALLGLPAPVFAQDVDMETRTVFDVDELLHRDLTFSTRQRFSQRLNASSSTQWSDYEHELDTQFQLRITTNFARRFRETALDPRQRQAADIQLDYLSVRYGYHDRFEVELGRQLLFDGLSPIDLDGGVLRFGAPHGPSASVAFGREVRYDLLKVDSTFADLPSPRWVYLDDLDGDSISDTRWHTQPAIGWTTPTVRFRLAHRIGHASDRVVQQRSGGVARGRSGIWSGTARFEYDHLLQEPIAVALTTRIRVMSNKLDLLMGWLASRPSFDVDSIFAVFPSNASVGWRLNANAAISDRWRLHLSSTLRSLSVDEDTDWTGGLVPDAEARSFGGQAGADWRALDELRLSLDVGATGGYGGLLLSADGSVRWAVIPDRLDTSLRFRQAYRDDDRDLSEGWIGSARWRMGYALSRLGRLTAIAEYLADYKSTARFRFTVGFDFAVDIL